MLRLLISCVMLSLLCEFCVCDNIYHEKSKITFYPDNVSEYFGYTVVLRNTSLLVGAPKARSRVKTSISPGLVFSCRLYYKKNITCFPLGMDEDSRDISVRRTITVNNFFRDDMWFGATIATMPNDKLLVCAPRWADPYKDKHLLANGACYVETKRRGTTLTPLKELNRLAFVTNGQRKEYGEYGVHLNFYAYGQAGISVKVTDNNSIIIGAPGLLQWTGGIVDYKFGTDPNSIYFSKQPIHNPYYTNDMGPDDYFGYSVESGVFQTNGSTLYVAGGPRSKMGYGQVLIFDPVIQEFEALKIKAKLRGPQLGSYFGATLCCTDLNGDGRSDLLVGAPNFIKKDGGLPYDQGAVFVYLSAGDKADLIMEETPYVVGCGKSGARFGSAIAELGDIDDDGYKDVAIGAPWENSGMGAVYIYRGSHTGLKTKYTQRIIAEGAKSFGISISKGMDIDNNNCNDLAVGAHGSGTAYLYRCIPTIHVRAAIQVPDAMNLPQNATNFTALFCVFVPPRKSWPDIKIDLKATIIVDLENNRAMISGDSVYTVTARPGNDVCGEQVVEVKSTADLSKPISIKFTLEAITFQDSTEFPQTAARLSEDSTLHSSFLIQLIRDCGDDMICTPWLVMTLEPLNTQYIPGTEDRLGAKLTVFNEKEPAYGATVHLILPSVPKRVPGECTLEELKMFCEVPAPLPRGESVEWEIELEYTLKSTADTTLVISAKLEDVLYRRNISATTEKEITIKVTPMANFSVSGKARPNATIMVTRDTFYQADNISFEHYFEITNFGPSDWSNLDVKIQIPDNLTLLNPIKGCEVTSPYVKCSWAIPAKVSMPVVLTLKYNLKQYGKYLEEQNLTFNATTYITLLLENHEQTSSIWTLLVLDPSPPIWPLIVGIIAGLLVLAAMVYGLYKYGFFSRTRRDELKRLQDESQPPPDDAQSSSSTQSPLTVADESTVELITDDSD